MPFTAQEIENYTAAALDFHWKKGKIHSQSIQDKPLLKAMEAKKKTFPGGKELITVRVKGVYDATIQGFSHDDTVTYENPANIRTASYPWKEFHKGISMTLTELKKDGISVVDSMTGKSTSKHSDREMTALAGILDDKLESLSEGYARGKNLMYWRDGTQDANLVPGIRSFVVNVPTTATVVGGIDQAANTWWRNRASLTITNATAANAADQHLVRKLQQEIRQLRRYGGRPDMFLCGSDFITQFEDELRAKGNYTEQGWAKSGRLDASVGDVEFKGVQLEYDPTLDDEGLSKYGFWLDSKTIFPMVMEGEDDKQHNPARPEDKYVMYKAITWTGGLVCRQRNANGVYSLP